MDSTCKKERNPRNPLPGRCRQRSRRIHPSYDAFAHTSKMDSISWMKPAQRSGIHGIHCPRARGRAGGAVRLRGRRRATRALRGWGEGDGGGRGGWGGRCVLRVWVRPRARAAPLRHCGRAGWDQKKILPARGTARARGDGGQGGRGEEEAGEAGADRRMNPRGACVAGTGAFATRRLGPEKDPDGGARARARARRPTGGRIPR